MRSKINPSLAQRRRQCRVNFCHLSLRLKPLVLRRAASARSKDRCRLSSPRSCQDASTSAYWPDPPGPVSCTKAAGPSSRSGPPNLRLGQLTLPAFLLSPPVKTQPAKNHVRWGNFSDNSTLYNRLALVDRNRKLRLLHNRAVIVSCYRAQRLALAPHPNL